MKYTINVNGENRIVLNDIEICFEVFDDFDYTIKEREELVDNLIMWISETKSDTDKELMKNDLHFLMNIKDKYIISSLLTNKYVRIKSGEGQLILRDIYNEIKKSNSVEIKTKKYTFSVTINKEFEIEDTNVDSAKNQLRYLVRTGKIDLSNPLMWKGVIIKKV